MDTLGEAVFLTTRYFDAEQAKSTRGPGVAYTRKPLRTMINAY